MTIDNFHIKPGYRINPFPRSVTHDVEMSRQYQVAAYRLAADLVKKEGLESVLDVGCGLGVKLAEIIAPLDVEVVGVDLPVAICECRTLHRVGRWEAFDIESTRESLDQVFDLVMSVDVIEHLMHPDRLLKFVRRHVSHRGFILLTTPERDKRRGTSDLGPPANSAHVREWNAREFASYLISSGFELRDHRTVDLLPGIPTCQVVICKTIGIE